MKGHPVFLAQHATGTCCRGCLEKWHGIPKGTELTQEQQEYIADVIIKWVGLQMETPSETDPRKNISNKSEDSVYSNDLFS